MSFAEETLSENPGNCLFSGYILGLKVWFAACIYRSIQVK